MVKGQFRIEVMGVKYPNADGSDRREIIRDCDEGEELILKHMPVPQDKNAVAIFNSQDEQLGWAPAWNAKELAPILKRGEHVSAIIEELKGSKCTILITKPGAAASAPKPTIPIARANYNCGVCGHKIDIKTSKCPSCGSKICTNCGNPIGSSVTKCPKCGEATTFGGIQSLGCLLFAGGILIIIFMVLFFVMC
jgi:ribosomal protein L40E